MTRKPHSWTTRSIVSCVALVCCASFAVSCGGDDDGEKNDGPKQRVVEERDLDLGSAVAIAATVDTSVEDLADARAVEASRIAEVLVDPVTVDQRFQRGGLPSGAMASPTELTRLLADVEPKLFAKRVSGATSNRSFVEQDSIGMNNTLLTFDTEADAARFVKEVGDKNERNRINQFTGGLTYGKKISIPGQPTVRASTFEVEKNDPDPSVTALTNRGRVVAYIYSTGQRAQIPELLKILDKVFDAQFTALEGFEPRSLREILGRRIDTTGVAKLALRSSAPLTGKHEPNIPRVWGRNGALHVQSWVGGLDEAFERADVDALAQSGSSVYRAGSVAKAKRLLKDFDASVTDVQYRSFHTPKGLREAKCYKLKIDSSVLYPNVCMVQYGRYVAEAGGKDNATAEGLISAQYLVFQEALGESKD